MTIRPQDEPPLPEELETADRLLDKADALIRRHRGSDDAALDDLPVLTDVVALPRRRFRRAARTCATVPAVDKAALATRVQALLAERMVELDASIGRSVEEWLADELPQIISREFDAMTERIRIHTLAHMRATLLPEISGCIAQVLDELPQDIRD